MAEGRTGSAGIRVEGLRDLRAELRRADALWPRELGRANKEIVEELIVPGAKERMARVRPRAGHAVIDSIRGSAASTRAQVLAGGARVPHYFGKEFGSIRYKQFPPWRGNKGEAGYAIWPTIREKREEFIGRYLQMLRRLTDRAFPD